VKAIICTKGDIQIFSFGTSWTSCPCGNAKAKWIDPNNGTVVVAAKIPEHVRLLGLHNGYLIGAIAHQLPALPWSEYQKLHDASTEAPNYLFDKSRIGCWAAVVRIGRSNDVRWATGEEFADAFPDAEAERLARKEGGLPI